MNDHLAREQLIELVEKIQKADGTEDEIHGWLMQVRRNVPDPNVSNLIFYYDSGRMSEGDMNLSAEEIIDRALAYKPIILGPATEPD
jgi:hypothetical protein